jgi:hypothetical protein
LKKAIVVCQPFGEPALVKAKLGETLVGGLMRRPDVQDSLERAASAGHVLCVPRGLGFEQPLRADLGKPPPFAFDALLLLAPLRLGLLPEAPGHVIEILHGFRSIPDHANIHAFRPHWCSRRSKPRFQTQETRWRSSRVDVDHSQLLGRIRAGAVAFVRAALRGRRLVGCVGPLGVSDSDGSKLQAALEVRLRELEVLKPSIVVSLGRRDRGVTVDVLAIAPSLVG